MEITKEDLFKILIDNGMGRKFTAFVDKKEYFISDHVYVGQEKNGKFLIAPRANGISENLKVLFKGYKNVKVYPVKISDTISY